MKKTNIFISYCHKDIKNEKGERISDSIIDKIKTHLSPLNEQIDIWCDEDKDVGKNLLETIDKKLSDSHLIIYIFSPNFIASEQCKQELQKGLTDCKTIFPIHYRDCAWKDITLLNGSKFSDSSIEVHPYDGKPLISYDNIDSPLKQIYEKINQFIRNQTNITKEKKITDSFNDFLEDTEFTFFHHQETPPKLSEFYQEITLKALTLNQDTQNEYNSEEQNINQLIENLKSLKKITISGVDLSGRTVLSKILFLKIYEENIFTPIWLSGKKYAGNINKTLEIELETQLGIINSQPINDIIIIIDDAHYLTEKKIKEFYDTHYSIIFLVDHIFEVTHTFKNKYILNFRIQELSYQEQYTLIKKWISSFKDKNESMIESYQQKLDSFFLTGIPA